MVPKKAGSTLETLTVSVLPVVERHVAPVVVKMTVEAVFVNPDQAVQEFFTGTVNPGPTKVVPPLPKPPAVAMQNGPPSGKVWPGAKWIVPLLFTKSPVSATAPAPEVAKRFRVPFGAAVLLPVGSTRHWKLG